MESNFAAALPLVLAHEGGYVNHPKDPGGATNKGVTQRTYDAYRGRMGQARQSVRHITASEVSEIYRGQYWDKIAADDMPAGLDYALFDFAVNSGPARAAQFLQRIVGVDDDGIIGAQTIAAVKSKDTASVIAALCANRLAWLKRLSTFSTFGRGWTRRVNEVKATALGMVGEKPAVIPTAAPAEAPGKAEGKEKPSAAIFDLAKDPKAWAAGSGLIASLGGVLEGSGPIQYAFAAAIVIGVALLAYKMVRR